MKFSCVIERVWLEDELEEEAQFRKAVTLEIEDIQQEFPGLNFEFITFNGYNLVSDFYSLLGEHQQGPKEAKRCWLLNDQPLSYNRFVRAVEQPGYQDLVEPCVGAASSSSLRQPHSSEFADGEEAARSTDDKFLVRPGEAAALEHLKRYVLEREQYVLGFSKPSTNAMFSRTHIQRSQGTQARTTTNAKQQRAKKQPREQLELKASTTLLSPYLSCGFLSVRVFWSVLKDIERRAYERGEKCTSPPQSLAGQLLWREFAHFLGWAIGSGFASSEIESNPLTLQHGGWGWAGRSRGGGSASTGTSGGEQSQEIQEQRHRLDRYLSASTGFAAIDAGLQQLKQEGWIHHIMRHLLASFFTRGGLGLHWELGAGHCTGVESSVFESHLLDFDWAINASQWQWLSASMLFYQFNRVYNADGFARKHDKRQSYRRHWLLGSAKGGGGNEWWCKQAHMRQAESASMQTLFETSNTGTGFDFSQGLSAGSKNEQPVLSASSSKREEAKHITSLKQSYLKQEQCWYLLLGENVVREWEREDKEFGTSLRGRVESAKRAFNQLKSVMQSSVLECGAQAGRRAGGDKARLVLEASPHRKKNQDTHESAQVQGCTSTRTRFMWCRGFPILTERGLCPPSLEKPVGTSGGGLSNRRVWEDVFGTPAEAAEVEVATANKDAGTAASRNASGRNGRQWTQGHAATSGGREGGDGGAQSRPSAANSGGAEVEGKAEPKPKKPTRGRGGGRRKRLQGTPYM
jgi:deoxyribodipyrimidine photolyase